MSQSDFLKQFTGVSFFQLINSASAFIINILIARWMGPQAFGNFYIFITTAIISTILFEFGLNRTLLRFSAFHEARGEVEEKLRYYSTVLRLKTILGIIVLALGLSVSWFWVSELRWQLSLGLITGFIVSYCQFFSAVAQTEKDYTAYNLVLSFNTLRLVMIGLAGIMGVVLTGYLYTAFIAAPLLLASFPAWRLGRSLRQAAPAAEPLVMKKLIQFGKWMILLSVLETIYQRLDVFMVRGLTSAGQAGYYSAALAFFGIVYLLPSYSALLVYPRLVEAVSHNDKVSLAKYFRYSTDLMAIIAVPLALGLWAVSPELISLLLGPKYAASAPMFKYMMIYSILWSCQLNSGALFFAQDKPKLVVIIVLITLMVNFVINWLLIPRMGIAGAGIAICSAMAVSLLLYWGTIKVKFDLGPDLKHIGIYLFSGIVMAAAIRMFSPGSWMILSGKIIFGAMVYGMIIWAMDRWCQGRCIPKLL